MELSYRCPAGSRLFLTKCGRRPHFTSKQGHSEPSRTQSKEDSNGVGTIPRLDNSNKSQMRLTAHIMALDPQFCVQYDSFTKSITITCNFANLSHIDKVLKNPNVLTKDGQGTWVLNANLPSPMTQILLLTSMILNG